MFQKNNNSYGEAQYRLEQLNEIRRDKFELILPDLMKKLGIDMWIHISRRGANDPLGVDFGFSHGVMIVSEKDGVLEKALFGHAFANISDPDFFTYMSKGYSEEKLYELDVLGEKKEISEYIVARKPKVIAANFSEEMSMLDSMSSNDMRKLKNILGETYSKRLISSQELIGDFRSTRVAAEIVLMGRLCEIQRRILEKLLKEIVPGKTTLRQLATRAHGELIEWGLAPNDFQLIGIQLERDGSHGGVYDDDPDVRLGEGDLLFWDWGFERINMNYGTDFKRTAYILKSGERDAPADLKRLWNKGIEFRAMAKREMRSGRTGKEILKSVIDGAGKMGLIHMPFLVQPEERMKQIQAMPKENICFSIDFHTIGNAGTDYEVGTPIAPQRPYRSDETARDNQFNAFEFFITGYVPSMNRWQLFNFEDDVCLTPEGAQYLYPAGDSILII